MSQINQKKPQGTTHFGSLNNRKPTDPSSQTVGNTYGERRQKLGGSQETVAQYWLKRAKDFFLGGSKNTGNIDQFANNADRYEGVRSNPVLSKMARLEEGSKHLVKTQIPPNEKYVGFLNSVIQYLDAKKKV